MKALFLGDLCTTEYTDRAFDERNTEFLFGDIKELFSDSDFSFVNLECAITESNNRIYKFGPNLKACKNTAWVLRDLGCDLAGLSNNHTFDFGIEGINDTMHALRENGIAYTGYGNDYDDSRRDYIIERDGERIAILAVCEHEYSYALADRMGARPFDPFDTPLDVRRAKESADRVVVIYHGGKEYCEYPSPRLYKACHAMAESGADLIICQHSHCIGCYECHNGTHILYGQGNFHFITPEYAEGYPAWEKGLALKYDTKKNSVEFVPLTTEGFGMRVAAGDTAEKVLGDFAVRNARLAKGEWLSGWREFCLSQKEKYTDVIANAFTSDAGEHENHLFAHFFDCEAHHDVWAELFKTSNHTNEK